MMTARSLFALLSALFAAGGACAANLDIEVRGTDGQPVTNAVVTVHLQNGATPAARAQAGGYAIDQRNLQFHPFVTVVPVGAQVRFLNHDPVRHHVYSFSAAKRFELKLEKQQQDRTVTFDKVGIAPLGCNIHDSMIAFIDVVDTAWSGITDNHGHVQLVGLPAFGLTVDVWHPYLRAVGNHVARTLSLAANGQREAFTVALRSPPRPPAQPDY